MAAAPRSVRPSPPPHRSAYPARPSAPLLLHLLPFDPTGRRVRPQDPAQEAALAVRRRQIAPVKAYCEHFRALIVAENHVEQARAPPAGR